MRSPLLVRAAGPAILATVAACQWGTRPREFRPARGPAGAEVAVHVAGERRDRLGELYAVDTAGVLIARNARLVRIAWARLAAMDVERLGNDYDVSPRETVDAAKRERLSLVSRFPQGLSGPLLAQVLARFRQDAVDAVE
jgi:hypothetical protein